MKNNSKIFLFAVCIIFLGILYSCNKDEEMATVNEATVEQTSVAASIAPQSNFEYDTGSGETIIVLGAKRINPFAVNKMNQAKTLLYGSNAAFPIVTHKYVKFKPTSQEHLDLLEKWDFESKVSLFDFPLEYKIIQPGDSYYDPAVSDSIYTYQYASIPEGTQFPNVPYELIDLLHIDKIDKLQLAESFWMTNNRTEINEYVFQGGLTSNQVTSYTTNVRSILNIPPLPDEPCPDGFEWKLIINKDWHPSDGGSKYVWECQRVEVVDPPGDGCTCPVPSNRRFPAGCVRVDNDNTFIPVERAMVVIKDDWFSSNVTFTSDQGCWNINVRHSGNVWMWVRFINANVRVRDVRYWLSLRAVRDYVGKYNAPPYNNISVQYASGASDNTSKARIHWAAAHSLNTVNQYLAEATADNIPLPRLFLNWTNAAGKGGAAAPMLQGNAFNSWPAFLVAFSFKLNDIYFLTLPHLPDIVNQYRVGESPQNFNGSGFHELGHASHYSLVGENYWFGYRNHIINNKGYGAFGDFSALGSFPNRVALGEAVGNFIGNRYGGTDDGGETGEWGVDNFIPQGLLFDLQDDDIPDTVTDPNDASISGMDNITGFTPFMFFNALEPNVMSIRAFRDRLRDLHLNDTPNSAADFNAFVDIYDVFN